MRPGHKAPAGTKSACGRKTKRMPATTLSPSACLDHMAKHPVAQLRLEPCALRRHDSARVGDRHEFLDAGRIHRESAGVFATVDQLLQFRCAADAADEIDSLA